MQPFDLAVKAVPRFAYYVAVPPHRADQPLIQAFRKWLLEEAAAMEKPVGRTRGKRARS